MEERQLSFNNDQNPEIVVLSEEEKKEVLKTAKDLHLAIATFHQGLSEGTLETGFKNTLLSLFESNIISIHKALGFESHLKTEHDKRYVEIRSLNHDNHELRKQLGEKVSNDDVREKLKIMEGSIRDWWKKEGFGYISEISFGPYSCKVNLSCSMSFHHEKTQPEYLRSKGYLLAKEDREDYLSNTDENQKLLVSEISKKFPSSKVTNMKIDYHREPNIRDCEFIIRDYNNI